MLSSAPRSTVNLSKIQKLKTGIRAVSSSVTVTTNQKPWTQIPGPKSYPIIGPLLNFLPGGELQGLKIDFTQKLHEKYGPIVKLDKIFGKRPTIFIFDAESASKIMRAENITPVLLGIDSLAYYRKVQKNVAPESLTGLLTENGKRWKEFRSAVNPVLMQPKTIKLYTSVIDEVASEMVERLKSLRNDKHMIPNLDKELNLWSLESIGVVALGCRLKCFDNNLDKDSPVKQLITNLHELMSLISELDIVKPSLWKYYPTKSFKKAMEGYKQQETLAKYFIDQAIREFRTNPKPNSEKGVLEKLLDINENVAITMATDMLLGGVDSVTITTLATLYLLASNPDKQSKLRAELKANDENRPYLKACVKEALRLMPAGLGTARVTTKEYNILGYQIPKDILVMFAHMEMSRMDKYFMKAHDYIPERWLGDKEDPFYNKNHFAMSPFGFGVRSCIGRRVAELEVQTFIGRAIENFEISWFGPPPKVYLNTLNYVLGPYNFIFKDAKN